MDNINLSVAEKKDASVLFDFLKQLAHGLGKEKDFKGSIEAIAKFGFGTPPAFEAIIAWQGNTPLGFILYFYEFSTWRGLPGIYVQDLFVTSKARGLGLGGRLTSEAIARGKKREATYMRLAVHEGNDLGSKFYQAMGFEAITNETIFLLEGQAFDFDMTKGN